MKSLLQAFLMLTINFDHNTCFRCKVILILSSFFTPPRNRGGVIFSLQFVCVSVCVCVRPDMLVNKIPAEKMHQFGRNSSRTDAPIWTRFSLNGCLLHWLRSREALLRSYRNWWPLQCLLSTKVSTGRMSCDAEKGTGQMPCMCVRVQYISIIFFTPVWNEADDKKTNER